MCNVLVVEELMYCYDCRGTDFTRVFIPIPVNTRRPTVCEDCAKERERKWGHTWKKGTGKFVGKVKVNEG